MADRLDKVGLSYLWNKLKALFDKADLNARAYSGIQSNNMTAITNGQDLNDFKTFGVYYAQTNAIASSIVNTPVKSAFQLKVLDTIHQPNRFINQEVISYNGYSYRRVWNGSTWGAWVQWDSTTLRSTAISNHNTSTTAHNNLFSALESRLAELEAWKEEIKNG